MEERIDESARESLKAAARVWDWDANTGYRFSNRLSLTHHSVNYYTLERLGGISQSSQMVMKQMKHSGMEQRIELLPSYTVSCTENRMLNMK